MPRKFVISESFRDGETEAVMTARVPKTLYGLITEDAEAQGVPISTLLRDVLGLHYLPEHLKTKLKEDSSLTAADVTMLEGLRSHVAELIGVLQEIDILRSKKPDEAIKRQQLVKNIHEELDKDEVKKLLMDELVQKIIKDLFPGPKRKVRKI